MGIKAGDHESEPRCLTWEEHIGPNNNRLRLRKCLPFSELSSKEVYDRWHGAFEKKQIFQFKIKGSDTEDFTMHDSEHINFPAREGSHSSFGHSPTSSSHSTSSSFSPSSSSYSTSYRSYSSVPSFSRSSSSS